MAREQQEQALKLQKEKEQKELEVSLERKRKLSELEQYEAESKRMKIQNDIVMGSRQHQLKAQDLQREQRALALEEQRLAAQVASSAHTRENETRALEQLAKPREDMLAYARGVNERNVDSQVLGVVEAKGFSFFTDPAYFVVPQANVEAAATSALQNLP